MKRVVFCLIMLMLAGSVKAGSQFMVSGKVLDGKSKPLPYASIFFKHHPQIGTVSNEKGQFSIEFGSDTAVSDAGFQAAEIMKDTVIISMLGYQTIYAPAAMFTKGHAPTLRLKEYTYTLDEAIVKGAKNDRKQHRKEMKRLLEHIYERLTTVDAIQDGEEFRIVSDIVVLKDSIPLTIDHLTGSLTEWPGAGKDGNDSIAIDVETYSNYMDSSVRKVLQPDTGKVSITKYRAAGSSTIGKWNRTTPHKTLWNITDVKKLLKNTRQEEKLWNDRTMNDSTLMVVFSRTKKVLGIVSATQKIVMAVDSRTYAISSARCHITVKLTLPFGYKLKSDELEILNMVNLNADDIEKFKIKTAMVQISGTVVNKEQNGRMLPSEKSMKNTLSIADRKSRKISFVNTCMLKVMD